MQMLLVFVLLVLSQTINAKEILQDVSIVDQNGVVEVATKLSVPFNYVKHFPRSRGKIIQIQIRIDDESLSAQELKRRETITPDSSEILEIRDVIYEGNVRGGPYLVLRFNSVVNFTIKHNENTKQLSIFIKKDTSTTDDQITPVTKQASRDDKQASDEATLVLRDARSALTNGNNSQAILLFTKLLNLKGHKYMADAKEYLGVARERNGQLELAKKEYEEYLKLYKDSRRANTVKQRLMTLNARLSQPKRDLKESKRQIASKKRLSKNRVDLFGRVSQIYYNAYINREQASSSNQQNMLLSFLDVTRRERDENKETRLVFSGSHELDFLNANKMEARIRSIYGEYKGKRSGVELSLGRQSVNSGGVLGRFDGGLFGFRLRQKIKMYLVAGVPVDFIDHHNPQWNKPMFGARVDFNELAKNWKTSIYAIQQQVDGVVNRSAVGADARYFTSKKIFYSLIDYDVSYQTVNFLTAHFGFQLNKKTKLDVHFDRRRSPVMLTSNALQGLTVQTKTTDEGGNVISRTGIELEKGGEFYETSKDFKVSIKNLLDIGVTEEEIRQRAIDNTGYSTLVTTSFRRSLTDKLEFNANLTLSKYEAGKNIETNDDDEPEDTSFLPSDLDYIVYGQLIRRNFHSERDILIGGLRYSSNANSTRAEVNSSYRFLLKPKWWLDAKARIMYTTNKKDNKNSVRINPKLRTEYALNRKFSVEGEIGTEINKSQLEGEDYSWTTVNMGFRYLF